MKEDIESISWDTSQENAWHCPIRDATGAAAVW
jgi:hypothetical protein